MNYKRIIYNVIVTLLVLAGLAAIVSRFVHLGNVEYTDNAQLRQHITPVNSRVQGYVKEVRFDEYTPVKRGDTLLIIEDVEYRLKVAQAEANLVGLTSAGSATGSGVGEAQSRIMAAKAALTEAAARMANAEKEYQRYKTLLEQKAVTQQQYDNVYTAYVAAKANHEQAREQLQALSQARNQQGHRLEQSDANIKMAQVALEQARLNLSYTIITSPCDGMISTRDIVEGQLIQPGQKIVEVVDVSDIWVIANYRETQLKNIAIGAPVDIKVDALPDLRLTGTVQSVSDATGAALKNIPQDNATGNFVKVVQRVPVRISLKGNPPATLQRLRAGMNVECEVKYNK